MNTFVPDNNAVTPIAATGKPAAIPGNQVVRAGNDTCGNGRVMGSEHIYAFWVSVSS